MDRGSDGGSAVRGRGRSQNPVWYALPVTIASASSFLFILAFLTAWEIFR